MIGAPPPAEVVALVGPTETRYYTTARTAAAGIVEHLTRSHPRRRVVRYVLDGSSRGGDLTEIALRALASVGPQPQFSTSPGGWMPASGVDRDEAKRIRAGWSRKARAAVTEALDLR